jgi:hypothetical protein
MSQIWYNDMSYKDRDDCGKRLLCELNAKARFFPNQTNIKNYRFFFFVFVRSSLIHIHIYTHKRFLVILQN